MLKFQAILVVIELGYGYNMIYKKSWKYILKHTQGPLNRIKAVKDSLYIKEGEDGGFVQGYHNLSQKGDCWVYDRAMVCGYAKVSENAVICENAIVSGNAQVSGNALVCDRAKICDAIVKGNMVVTEEDDI